MIDSLSEAALIKAQTERDKRIATLREQHPELLGVETALLQELSLLPRALTRDSEGNSSYPENTLEQGLSRLGRLRKQRMELLESLGLPDDYAAPVYRCPVCHDRMVIRRGDSWVACECFHEQRAALGRERAGISQRMKEQTFATFSLDFYSDECLRGEQESKYSRALKVVDACQQLVLDLVDAKVEYGLYIFGNPGVGKTHLVAAMANSLIAEGIDVRYTVSSTLLVNIRATYDKDNSEAIGNEGYILTDLATVPLLFLDDLGVERFTSWEVEKLYGLINQRYLAKLPTVFTSNLPLDNLEEEMGPGGTATRIVSRIAESCRVFLLDGEDLRFHRR